MLTPKEIAALPRPMRVKEFCVCCGKEMGFESIGLKEDESAVEAWYQCVCGNRIGALYSSGHVDVFCKTKGIKLKTRPMKGEVEEGYVTAGA